MHLGEGIGVLVLLEDDLSLSLVPAGGGRYAAPAQPQFHKGPFPVAKALA